MGPIVGPAFSCRKPMLQGLVGHRQENQQSAIKKPYCIGLETDFRGKQQNVIEFRLKVGEEMSMSEPN